MNWSAASAERHGRHGVVVLRLFPPESAAALKRASARSMPMRQAIIRADAEESRLPGCLDRSTPAALWAGSLPLDISTRY